MAAQHRNGDGLHLSLFPPQQMLVLVRMGTKRGAPGVGIPPVGWKSFPFQADKPPATDPIRILSKLGETSWHAHFHDSNA